MVQIDTKQNRSTIYKIWYCLVYLSITNTLLDNTVIYAQLLKAISNYIIQLVKKAGKSLLLLREIFEWKKVKRIYLMLLWDHIMQRRSVSLLVLPNIIEKKNLDLYRDDGLLVIENANLKLIDLERCNS